MRAIIEYGNFPHPFDDHSSSKFDKLKVKAPKEFEAYSKACQLLQEVQRWPET